MAMLTDVQIAQSAQMQPIKEIAAKVGLSEDDLELYGKYKAKISLEAISKVESNKERSKKMDKSFFIRWILSFRIHLIIVRPSSNYEEKNQLYLGR